MPDPTIRIVGATLSGLPAYIRIMGYGIWPKIRDFYPDLPPTSAKIRDFYPDF